MGPNELFAAQRRQIAVRQRADSSRSVELCNLLTSPKFLQSTDALLAVHRERLYPPTDAPSMFTGQVLHAHGIRTISWTTWWG